MPGRKQTPYKLNFTLHAYEEDIISHDIRRLGGRDIGVSELQSAAPMRYHPHTLATVLKRMTKDPINASNKLKRRQSHLWRRRRWVYSFPIAHQQSERKAA